MPRKLIRTALAVGLALLALPAGAYAQDSTAREAEWNAYKLPTSNFVRYVDPSKTIMIRVPAGWKQQGSDSKFIGPDQTTLHVFIEQVPDGMPLQALVAGGLKSLRNLPGGPDALRIRRTQLSGLEAREIMFDLSDADGALSRRILWFAVDGPNAFTLLFIAPLERAAELEPYFKAVAQSAVVFRSHSSRFKWDFGYDDFESHRISAIKDSPAARIDEVQSLVSELDGADSALRAKAVTRLASIFAVAPDSAIDLIMEERPLVRAAAVEAIGASGNKSLDQFLVMGLSDPDSYAAARAAIALASRPDAVALIRNEIGSGNYTSLLRASAFLDEKSRIQIANELFNRTFIKPPPVAPPPPAIKGNPARPPLPPPAPGQPANQPSSQKRPTTGPQGPREVMEVPGGVPGGVAGGVPGGLPGFVAFTQIPINEDFLALNLVRNIPASGFTLPFAQVVARKNDGVIATMLQIALDRHERLPVDELFKLILSKSPAVARLAAMNLVLAVGRADIPRIESMALIASKATPLTPNSKRPASGQTLEGELRTSIAKILFKEKLEGADQQSRRQSIQKGLADPQLASWVWTEYARDEIEGPPVRSGGSTTSAAGTTAVSPLGDNLFPRQVALYVALPRPAAAIGKLSDGLANLQTESARSQATLVLMMSAIRAQIATFFGAQGNEPLLEHLGITPDRPIAFAKWTAEGAPRGLGAAERKAILIHVSDRDRFEHLLALYQERAGNFARLPEFVSVFARFLGFAPAILPMSALTVLKEGMPSTKPKETDSIKYRITGRDECLGHAVRIFERREVTFEGQIKSDSIYLAYSGDAAVLAPDWYSLRDTLNRLDNNRGGLAGNPEFKRAVATGGDAIYLSNPSALFSPNKQSGNDEVTESGALKISNSAWENSYQLSFAKAGWASLFSRFQPKSLASPRELLPRSTLGYIFARPDLAAMWRQWGLTFFGPETAKSLAAMWALDFEKEIVPEFGNELGAALLKLPRLDSAKFDAPWVIFLRLKTDKLSRAFSEGKLFKGSATANRPAKIRIGSTNLMAAVKNGYLIFAASEAAIDQLDQKEKLDAARDFARAAEKAPQDVVAFGGYSLEAAVAELGTGSSDPVKALIINAASSMAKAFHSQSFYATETPGGLDARLSVSLDREGRYSVAELQSKSKDFAMTFAVIEARGVPIADQARVETMKLRIRAKADGVVDRIKEDIASPHQTSEKRSENELVIAVKPRHTTPSRKIQLSEIGPGFESFLTPTNEARSDDPTVIKQALEIVGADREAWSVARKLSDWTFKNLKWKRVDKADAAQTLATREADCMEFSQLFVAMARSLRLPARIVSGLAYGDGSFGGHAWVEVWAGEWIELDPTWGTDFVDATHIRTASGELISYAALNLLEMEVLEAPRSVPDFQRNPKLLAEKLCEDLPTGSRGVLSLALDPASVTDEQMGAGTWSGMTDREREQISSAYTRLVAGLVARFKPDGEFSAKPRLVSVTQHGDRADALILNDSVLERFKLAHRGEAWTLVEIVDSDSGYHVVNESLQPAIQAIRARRSGKPPASASASAQTQILLALSDGSAEERIKKGIRIADQALKDDPKNQILRHLKAMCLSSLAKDPGKSEEAVAIWTQLGEEDPAFAPALLSLASHYQSKDNKDSKRAIEVLQRYVALVPDDPGPHSSLSNLYAIEGDLARAEAEKRAEIELDAQDPEHYTELAELLAVQKRYDDALAAIDDGAKHGMTADELFADLLTNLYLNEREPVAEGLAAARPERLNRNAGALITLAHIRIDGGRPREALPLLKIATGLAPKNVEAHDTMAEAHRKLANWQAALTEADAAIRLDAKDSAAHYHRACALARLGRKAAAIAALQKAIEIDDELVEDLEDEEDLKTLAAMPEFKKLIEKKPDK